MSSERNLFICFVLFCALEIAGCSRGDRPELTEVQGIVTLDGKPLPRATVIFQPMNGGRSSRGLTDSQGKYRLLYLRDIEGAILGSHKVTITTVTEDDRKEILPARYNKQTTLAADVKAGKNQRDFQLTSQ
jgi:hypothetical protein